MTISRSLPFGFLLKKATPPPADRLIISNTARRHAYAAAGPQTTIPTLIWEHAFTTWRLALAGVYYYRKGSAAAQAYERMSEQEFKCINARQAWANWRTIPRNLSGNLPLNQPLTVLDLCCGIGDSTAALAWWLPSGSQIIGLEQNARFAEIAGHRLYYNRFGQQLAVTVHSASILDGFLDASGNAIAERSVDVVHAIGSLGCHFSATDTAEVLSECKRVLRADGFALLDAGRTGTSAQQLQDLATGAGFAITGSARSWMLDRNRQFVLRRSAIE